MESSAFSRQLHRAHLGEEWKFTLAAAESVLFLLPAFSSTPQEEVRQSVTPAEPVQYYFTLAQQPTAVQVQGQQQGQQTTSSTTTIQPGQIIIAQPQQGQVCELWRYHPSKIIPLRFGIVKA